MNTCIINSGASDHMTCDLSLLSEFEETKNKPKINLPNGKTNVITHTGIVRLENNLKLQNVLCVPEFKHNLLSVNKLVQQERCRVIFYRSFLSSRTQLLISLEELENLKGGCTTW